MFRSVMVFFAATSSSEACHFGRYPQHRVFFVELLHLKRSHVQREMFPGCLKCWKSFRSQGLALGHVKSPMLCLIGIRLTLGKV